MVLCTRIYTFVSYGILNMKRKYTKSKALNSCFSGKAIPKLSFLSFSFSIACIPHDLYFTHIKFTLLEWTSRSVMRSHIKFTLVAWNPCSITVRARSVSSSWPTRASGPTRNRFMHSQPIHSGRLELFKNYFGSSSTLFPNNSAHITIDRSMLQAHTYKVMVSGSGYIPLDPMLSCLYGIYDSSIFPIFSNFILT